MKHRVTRFAVRLLTGIASLWVIGAATAGQAVVTDIEMVIDRQDSPSPTPIHLRYAALLDSAGPGDELVLLQKYFHTL